MSNAKDAGSSNQNWCTIGNFIISFYSAIIIAGAFRLVHTRRKLIYEMIQYLKRWMFVVEGLQTEISEAEAAIRLLREEISALSSVRNQ